MNGESGNGVERDLRSTGGHNGGDSGGSEGGIGGEDWIAGLSGGNTFGSEKVGSTGANPEPQNASSLDKRSRENIESGTKRDTRNESSTSGDKPDQGTDKPKLTKPENAGTPEGNNAGSNITRKPQSRRKTQKKKDLVLDAGWGENQTPSEIPETEVTVNRSRSNKKAKGILSKNIVAVHKALSLYFGESGIVVTNEEAEEIASAINEFSKEFGFVVSGKAGAIIQLSFVLLVTEIPKIALMYATVKTKNKKPVGGENLEFKLPS